MIQLAGENTIDNESIVIDKKANATKKMAMWIANFVKNDVKPVFPPNAGGYEVNPLLQQYAKNLYGGEVDNAFLAPLASVVEALAHFTAAAQQGQSDAELDQLGKTFEKTWNNFLHDRQNFKDKYGLDEKQFLPTLAAAVEAIFKDDRK